MSNGLRAHSSVTKTKQLRKRKLKTFLADAFTLSELKLLLDENYPETSAAVDWQGPQTVVIASLVSVLCRRKLVDEELFELISKQRPKRHIEVEELRKLWAKKRGTAHDFHDSEESVVQLKRFPFLHVIVVIVATVVVGFNLWKRGLVVDDVIRTYHENSVLLDVRVRNIGLSTASLSRANIHVLSRRCRDGPTGQSASGSLDATAEYRSDDALILENEDNVTAIAHVLEPGEADRFFITVSADHCDLQVELIIRYNTMLHASSASFAL